MRLRAGKAWTLTPAPPQCPQGQPPPDATGHLGCPLPSCPAPQNGLTLPSLFHVRPPPLPGCPPRQRRPGLRPYLPAQRGPCSLQKRRALDIHHTCRPDRLGMPASSRPQSASAVCLDEEKAGQALDQQATSWGGGAPGVSPLRRPRSWPPLQALSLGGLIVLTPKGRGQWRIESDLGLGKRQR